MLCRCVRTEARSFTLSLKCLVEFRKLCYCGPLIVQQSDRFQSYDSEVVICGQDSCVNLFMEIECWLLS